MSAAGAPSDPRDMRRHHFPLLGYRWKCSLTRGPYHAERLSGFAIKPPSTSRDQIPSQSRAPAAITSSIAPRRRRSPRDRRSCRPSAARSAALSCLILRHARSASRHASFWPALSPRSRGIRLVRHLPQQRELVFRQRGCRAARRSRSIRPPIQIETLMTST